MTSHPFDLLGHSFAAEELKGDYAAARIAADRMVQRLPVDASPAARAYALIELARVLVLQGEPARALGLVGDARMIDEGADTQLLASSTAWFALVQALYTFPDGAGANSRELDDRSAAKMAKAGPIVRWSSSHSPAHKLDAALLSDLTFNLQLVRSTLQLAHGSGSANVAGLLEKSLRSVDGYMRAATEAKDDSRAAFAHWCAADLARRGRDHHRAHRELLLATSSYRRAGDTVGSVRCLITEADWLCAPSSSPALYNLLASESSTESSNLSATTERREFVRPSSSDVERARTLYADARRLLGSRSAPRVHVALAVRDGYLAALDGDWLAARRSAQVAAERAAACGDVLSQRLAQLHGLLAKIALGHLSDLGADAEALGRWGDESGSFSMVLGFGILLSRWARYWLMREGDYERALAAHEASMRLFAALGAPINRAQSMVDCGLIHELVNDTSAAVTIYERAIDALQEESERRPQLASALLERKAMLISSVVSLSLQNMDPDGMERSAVRMRGVKAEIEHGLLPDLQKLREGTPDLTTLALLHLYEFLSGTLTNLLVLVPTYRSRRARERGDDEAARESLFHAEQALQGIEDEAQRCFLTAMLRGEERRYEEGALAMSRYLELGGAGAGFAGHMIEHIEAIADDAAKHEKKLQFLRTHSQAFSVYVRLKAYGQAHTHLRILQQSTDDWWRIDKDPWVMLSDCGELFEGLSKQARGGEQARAHRGQALRYYELALEQLEQRRGALGRDELKTSFSGSKGAQYLYLQAARAALAAGDPERAFRFSEQGKARALLDLMASTVKSTSALASPHDILRAFREVSARLQLRHGLIARERGARIPDAAELARLTGLAAEDERTRAALSADLSRINPDFLSLVRGEGSVLGLAQVSSVLPADTLLLAYAFAGDDLLGWAIGPTGLVASVGKKLEARALTRCIAMFREACIHRESGESAARLLSEELLLPFAEPIRAARRLIIVPYGAAHSLPFHALPFDGAPLAGERVISYSPSASVLQFVRPSAALEGSLLARGLVIGNPTLDLPGAQLEAAVVAKLLGTTSLGDDATEARVRERAKNASVLHFATHGRLNAETPLDSAIQLAGGEDLTLHELMGLELSPSLVVLSACDTGSGVVTAGDELLGLTRGLLAAGARTAVVSLWPVDDRATTLLMAQFYGEMKQGCTPALALHRAQSYLRTLTPEQAQEAYAQLQETYLAATPEPATYTVQRDIQSRRGPAPTDYLAPYFWAPFIVVGA